MKNKKKHDRLKSAYDKSFYTPVHNTEQSTKKSFFFSWWNRHSGGSKQQASENVLPIPSIGNPDNPYILKWWTQQHDQLIKEYMNDYRWAWYCFLDPDMLIKIAPESEIEQWKSNDPYCAQTSWINVLYHFKKARAIQHGFINTIQQPVKKKCLLCQQDFMEDSLHYSLVRGLGINRLNFCFPCLEVTVLDFDDKHGNSKLKKKEILNYLNELATCISRVPTQRYGVGMKYLEGLSDLERLKLLKVLKKKPTTQRIKKVFGSWLNALIQAGVLEDGVRRTSRGIQSIAKDGHVCLSLGERTIDDLLFAYGIPHMREPKYPEGNYRGDFLVGKIMIEYFGLKGNLEYDKKIKLKKSLCKKHNIQLISIYPADLVSSAKLKNKLHPVFSLYPISNESYL
jgi:hypothetical protein